MSDSSTFLARALAEAARYGQDELVFLRELAQNARDAGAGRITVTTGRSGDGAAATEWVVFADDGCGMTLAHARQFFFRLYASSKEGEAEAAGRFGVGFWSVLRWRPSLILVESHNGVEGWAKAFDGRLEPVSAACSLASPGTRITLRRARQAPRAGQAGGEPLGEIVAAALRRYCRYLRRAGRASGRGAVPLPLPIVSDGVEINEPLELSPPSLAFRTVDAEGVVGLGPEPRVELWARGLLVAEAAVLDELDGDQPVPTLQRRAGGLAPVVLLQSDRLELVLSRQAARQSRALRRMLRLARGRVDRMVGHVLDGAAPRSWRERWGDRLRQPLTQVTAWHVAVAVLFLTLVVAAGVLFRVVSRPRDWAPPRVEPEVIQVRVESLPVPEARPALPLLLPYTNLMDYGGAVVEVPHPSMPAWGLSYEGPPEVFFRLAALEHYDTRRGFVPTDSPKREHPAHVCDADCIRVELQIVAPRGPLAVPVPSGHRLVPESVALPGVFRPKVLLDTEGDAWVELPAGLGGVLTYVTAPYRGGRRPTIQPVPVVLPPWATRAVERSRDLPPLRRARQLTAVVRGRLAYDVSPAKAAAFAAASGDWLNRVLAVGAGDCDVKNGLNVLLLRRAGLPARLAIGMVGRDGTARANLHAWTEYFAGTWRMEDATGSAAASPPVASASASIARARPESTAPPVVVSGPSALPTAGRLPQPAPIAAPAAASTLAWSPVESVTPPAAVEAPASMPEAVARPTPRSSTSSVRHDRWSIPALIGGPLGALLTVLLLVIGWRRRVREQVRGEGDAGATRRALAGMVRDALAHPSTWRANPALWQRRLLPTLAGRPMAVTEALTRAHEGRLFVSHQRSELARLAAAGGTAVLDGADPTFAEAVAALGRAVDLDALDRLRPLEQTPGSTDATPGTGGAALASVNQFLERLGLDTRCLVTAGLAGAPLRDVDLSVLRLPRGSRWPRRYVAINAEHREVQARLRLLAKRPEHGLLLWLDWLADYSELLVLDATRLRERAALELLAAWR